MSETDDFPSQRILAEYRKRSLDDIFQKPFFIHGDRPYPGEESKEPNMAKAILRSDAEVFGSGSPSKAFREMMRKCGIWMDFATHVCDKCGYYYINTIDGLPCGKCGDGTIEPIIMTESDFSWALKLALRAWKKVRTDGKRRRATGGR